MMKICLVLALTFVAGVASLQEGAAPGGEAAPEPYSYAYQTDSHGAAEQRDQQGRVTGFYTLVDADGRERRVEYVADEAGFRAKVATNEVGTKAENPANVEVVAAEPTPAQYAQAQYSASSYSAGGATGVVAAAAPVQSSAQYVRQQAYQTGAAVPAGAAQFGRSAYSQYAYQPGYYATGYYTGAVPAGYSNTYRGHYDNDYYEVPFNRNGGRYYSYRSSTAAAPAATAGYTYSAAAAPVGYSYGVAPAGGQYYSYRSSTVGAPATSGYTTGYRYSSVGVPVGGVSSYSSGFAPATGATFSATGPAGVTGSVSRGGYQGSSNYVVLQKREAAEKKVESSS